MLTVYEIALREHERQLQINKNHKYGLISDDPDGFYALSSDNVTAKLMPGPEFNPFLYRGQTRRYAPCRPSIYRDDSTFNANIFIKWMKLVLFKNIMSLHLAISEFKKATICGYRLSVNYEGLAQHYGLDTELMDFTSCPWTAAFFACTKYDEATRKYYPIEDIDENGIFYRLNLKKIKGFNPETVDIIGVQPLRRPIAQKAFSFRVKFGEDLHRTNGIEYQMFKHDSKAATKIYERFEGGDVLFSFCPVARMVSEISTQKVFSEDILGETLNMCRGHDINRSHLMAELKSREIKLTKSEDLYSFSQSDIDKMNIEWHKTKQLLEDKVFVRPILELVNQNAKTRTLS